MTHLPRMYNNTLLFTIKTNVACQKNVALGGPLAGGSAVLWRVSPLPNRQARGAGSGAASSGGGRVPRSCP